MLSDLKLTILCENRVKDPQLIAEQGLSILVETPETHILFDSGQTDTILKNAQTLNIDLSKLQKAVLSHGHFDLVGGLHYLIKKIGSLDIYCHPNLFNKKFKITNKGRVDIGVPWEKSDLEEFGANFILKTRPIEIVKDVWISGEIPRLTSYEYIDEAYQERVLESYIHDDIHDDMVLIINTRKGLVVLLGCGHAGPVNSIKHAMRITGVNKLHAIMGGMHLHQAPYEKIKKIVTHLIKLNPDYFIPLHCCGFRSINLLYNHLKNRVLLFNVGDSFTLNMN